MKSVLEEIKRDNFRCSILDDLAIQIPLLNRFCFLKSNYKNIYPTENDNKNILLHYKLIAHIRSQTY